MEATAELLQGLPSAFPYDVVRLAMAARARQGELALQEAQSLVNAMLAARAWSMDPHNELPMPPEYAVSLLSGILFDAPTRRAGQFDGVRQVTLGFPLTSRLGEATSRKSLVSNVARNALAVGLFAAGGGGSFGYSQADVGAEKVQQQSNIVMVLLHPSPMGTRLALYLRTPKDAAFRPLAHPAAARVAKALAGQCDRLEGYLVLLCIFGPLIAGRPAASAAEAQIAERLRGLGDPQLTTHAASIAPFLRMKGQPILLNEVLGLD